MSGRQMTIHQISVQQSSVSCEGGNVAGWGTPGRVELEILIGPALTQSLPHNMPVLDTVEDVIMTCEVQASYIMRHSLVLTHCRLSVTPPVSWVGTKMVATSRHQMRDILSIVTSAIKTSTGLCHPNTFNPYSSKKKSLLVSKRREALL